MISSVGLLKGLFPTTKDTKSTKSPRKDSPHPVREPCRTPFFVFFVLFVVGSYRLSLGAHD